MTTRKPERYPIPHTLREALYNVIHKSPIPAKAQAEELGLSLSYLYNSCNSELEGFEYQLRLLIPHTRITENYAVLDYIKTALNRIAIKIPAEQPSTADLIKEFSQTTHEFGDLANEISEALKDGKITNIEHQRLEKAG